MAQIFYEGYDPAWVLRRDKGPPIETKPKPPAPKPEERKPSPIELKVSCCEGCLENIREALIELDGVDSVKLNSDSEKVTITGKVKPEDALKAAKKVVRGSKFWPKKKEEEKKIDRLPKKGDLADNVQVVREHVPVRLEENSLERVASPVPQPVSAPQTTSESNQPGPFVHSPATPNRGPLPSPAPSPSALSPAALHPYAKSASTESDGDTPYLPSPHNPSQASSHPQVGMAQSQYDDGIHSNVQGTAGQLHAVCNDSAISARGTSCVHDLIRDVENRREDGYFLSSEWLLGLEQKQRESLMSIFSRAGYSETYHTGKTTLFERMENDVQSVIDGNNPLSVVTNEVTKNSFCYIDRQQFEAPEEGDRVESLNIGHRPGIGTFLNSEYLPETSDVPTAGETLTVENSSQITDPLPASPTLKDGLINMLLEEKAQEKCITNSTTDISLKQQPTTLKSFVSALKSSHSYAVSTCWLNTLEDHEKKELETTILEAGFTETHQGSNTITFERIRDDVGLPLSNLYNNPRSTSDKSDVGASDSDTGMQEASERGGRLWNDELKRKLESEDTRTEPFGLASTDQQRPKPDSTRTCIKQLLEVTCRSSSESSTSTGPLPSSQNLRQRSGRRLCGDSFATLPTHGKGHILPTKVDKVIPMKAFDFRGTCEYLVVPISLKVSIETTVSCCLRNDENRKIMRVKYLTIGGEVKHVQATEPNLKALVLKSIRTTVVACVDRSDRSDSHESINLDLEEEYSQSPRRRVLEKFPVSETGDQTKRLDRVWLALSGIKPESDELGSITVELQCHVGRTCKAQLQGTINGTHVLLFKDPRPITLEGDIYTSLEQESFFELDVRYQLEFSYIEPCKPFPQEAKPYLPGERKTVVVDFDCILEYQARHLSLC